MADLLSLPPALKNPNKTRRPSRPKTIKPPTARQLAEAIKSLCKRMRLSDDMVEVIYAFAILSVATSWSAVDFAVAAERAHQGRRKMKNDRTDFVGDLDKWLGKNRRTDLDASDEDKKAHNLLLSGLPQGRALKMKALEVEVLVDWVIHLFGAPKAGDLHKVDLPKAVRQNLRFANWFAQQVIKGDDLVRFNAQMKAAKWALMETIDAIFDAETSALVELVEAEQSRRDAARAEKEANAATAETEADEIPAAEQPEGSDVEESSEDEDEAAAS